MRPAKAVSCILSIVGVCALAPRTPAQTLASRHPIVIAASVVIDGKGPFNLTCARHRAGNACPKDCTVCGKQTLPLFILGKSRMRFILALSG
jgi:hypothetical protein